MLNLGVIGYGYWGPNVVRNFASHADCRVAIVCDMNSGALERVARHHPTTQVTNDPDVLLRSTAIDAVAIVTPVSTHYDLARAALENGKHVFVEKPLTATSAQAEALIELADRKRLQIMVDHTFLFNGGVRKIKELVDDGVLGPLYYYDSTRVNLGLFQHDVNVIWDLAPHDLSIIDYLMGAEPEMVLATGSAHLNGHADVAYITLGFAHGVIAHVAVSWLSPVKVRTTLIGGERRMVVWNDLDPGEPVKIYDRGVQVTSEHGIHELLVSYRSGDMWAPRIDRTEPLQLETRYFLDCVVSGTTPFNDGRAGHRVVRMLEAADASLRRQRWVLNRGGRQRRGADSAAHVSRLAPAS
jgi:predicted dehydrogenase